MATTTDTLIAFDTDERCKQPRNNNTAGAFGSYSNSPWGRRPSQETVQETRTYERPDGSRYLVVTEQSRWNGLWSEPREIRRVEDPKHIPTIQARFERAGQVYRGCAPTLKVV